MEEKKISSAVIRRLPRYYRYLGELIESGVQRISSKELSARMKVTASQIRQDLNNFGGFGQQGYGYNVQYLYEEIGKILGIDRNHNMVIIGAGNLGKAIVNYSDFEKRGFVIKGIFDNNPKIKGTKIRGIEVRMMNELTDFIKNNDIEIVALTMQAQVQYMAELQHLLCQKKKQMRQLSILCSLAFMQYGILPIPTLIFRMMLLLRMYICQKAL